MSPFLNFLTDTIVNPAPHPLADLLGLDPLLVTAGEGVFFWSILIWITVRAWRNRRPAGDGRG
jgi:hypothetical protein